MNILLFRPFYTAKAYFCWAEAFAHCMIFFVLFSIPLVFCKDTFASEGVAPSRDISIVSKDVVEPVIPDWMNLWEQARALSRSGEFDLAAELYAQLYLAKPSIEEASWEYCKVLMKIGDDITVESVLERLLEQAPNRSDYLLMAGDVAQSRGDYTIATRNFGRVFENDPVGEQADTALKGLVDSLRIQGKKKFALPLLEQLALRKPDDLGILSNVARDAHLLGENNKSHLYYKLLLQDPDVSDRIIFQAAQVSEEVNDLTQAHKLWLDYLSRHPGYLPFRKKVVDYLIALEKFEEVITHLEYLAINLHQNAHHLLTLGDIFLYELNRPDKALYYYEQYLLKRPGDKTIQARIVNIQTVLANDFLSIVENNGAWMLWRDLAAIAPNRLAIYLEMAEILEHKGKLREFVEILTVIFKVTPHSDSVAFKISQNLVTLREYDKALAYLDKISKQGMTKEVYLLRALIEQNLERGNDELQSLMLALQIDIQDHILLKKCLVMAGEAGLVEKQIEIFDFVIKNAQKLPSLPDLVTTHLYYLAENYMVAEYERIYEWAKIALYSSPTILIQFDILWADTLKKTGDKRKAEGILRNLLHDSEQRDFVLLALAENSLEAGRLEEAEVWHHAIDKTFSNYESEKLKNAAYCRLELFDVHLLEAEGRHQEALTLLEEKLMQQDGTSNVFPACQSFQLQKEICKLHYKLGDYSTAASYIEKLKETKHWDPEVAILRSKMSPKYIQPEVKKVGGGGSRLQSTMSTGMLVSLAREANNYGEYKTAKTSLNTLVEIFPESVVGLLGWADLLVATRNLSEAQEVLSQLLTRFPKETYILSKWVDINMWLGEYENTLRYFQNDVHGDLSVEVVIDKLINEGNTERLVMFARLLWGNKNNPRALEVYERLLSPSMAELMSVQFGKKQIDYQFLTKEDNFWNSLVYLLQSEPSVIAELMQPSFLLENLGNDTGRIVSENFEKFSWHKLIQNEYLARNAAYKRKYFYAEQSYKRLLKNQESTEGMLDLASIYERIGEYRKEAKVYEAIQSSGGSSPRLKSSIARTSMEISPQTSLDALYLKQSGRDGFKDLLLTSFGSTFVVTPNLNMDLQFQYENRNYESMEFDVSTNSNALTGQSTIEFGTDYELFIAAGIEKIDGISSAKLQYDLVLTGQLDDFLKAYVSLQNTPITDTVFAVEEQLYYQGAGIGFNFDTPVGISLGVDFLNLDIDGDNSQQKFHGYTSYNIFGDFTELVFKYDYHYLVSDQENDAPLVENVELMEDSLYYWSPASFTEHSLGAHFKHYFLGYSEQSRLAKSYYSLNSGFGYEDNKDLSYTGGFDIFFEMGPRFLLNGNFTLMSSDDYEEAKLSLSINYRW